MATLRLLFNFSTRVAQFPVAKVVAAFAARRAACICPGAAAEAARPFLTPR